MPEQVTIVGDLVRIENVELVREARLADVLPLIEHRPPVTMGLLPKSIRFIHWDESNPQNRQIAFLCELEPAVRSAIFVNRRYRIAIPWTYFLFTFATSHDPLDPRYPLTAHNTRVYWAQEPITNLDSQLGRALVPNCDLGGSICWGNTGVDITIPLGNRIDRTIHEFYQTVFTHDSGTGVPWGSETGLVTWNRWAAETQNDPQAWRRFPEWGQTGQPGIPLRSVRDILMRDGTQPRPTAIQVAGGIPDLPTPFTFGRAEEWLGQVTPADRHRLLVALQNLGADDPGAIVAPAPETNRRGGTTVEQEMGEPV